MKKFIFSGIIIFVKWSDIEVVITSYTGTVVVLQRARGFESHSLRQNDENISHRRTGHRNAKIKKLV